MRLADLNHGGARSDRAFVVLAVPSAATVPSVGPFHHPALLQGGESFRSLRTHLYLDAPVRSVRVHPSGKLMVVILVVAEDSAQSRKLGRRNLREQLGSGGPIVDA